MREFVFELFNGSVVDEDRLFGWSAIGVDQTLLPQVADGPFAFFGVRMNASEIKSDSNQGLTGFLELSIHDEPGDYTRIDAGLRAARTLLRSALPATTPRGRITAAEWQGDSDDFFDDALHTIYKTCSWRIVGSGEAFT